MIFYRLQVSFHIFKNASSSKSWWNALLFTRLIFYTLEEESHRQGWTALLIFNGKASLEIWSVKHSLPLPLPPPPCEHAHWLSSAWEGGSSYSENHCVCLSLQLCLPWLLCFSWYFLVETSIVSLQRFSLLSLSYFIILNCLYFFFCHSESWKDSIFTLENKILLSHFLGTSEITTNPCSHPYFWPVSFLHTRTSSITLHFHQLQKLFLPRFYPISLLISKFIQQIL